MPVGLYVRINSDGSLRRGANDDEPVNIRLSSREDAATVSAITDAAYSKYIPSARIEKMYNEANDYVLRVIDRFMRALEGFPCECVDLKKLILLHESTYHADE